MTEPEVERSKPYEGAEKRALSLSLEPCDAEDFAFAQRERNILEAPSRQSLGFENSGARRRSSGCAALHFLRLAAADHHFENIVVGGVLKSDRADAAAVAENGRALTEFADLGQPMGDVKDGRARGGRLTNETEQPVRLGQGGGRLVENEHLWIAGEGSRDFEPLALGERQARDDGAGRKTQTEAVENRRALLLRRRAGYQPKLSLRLSRQG